MKITLEDIFNIPSAVIYYPDKYKSVTSVSIDTRTIKKNSIFVAIKGDNFDGHNYVKEAVKKGATAIVVNNRKLKHFEDVTIPIISVKNTINAYAELAKIWRKKLSAKVISITGSNGKTSTKEIIAHLLSEKFSVHKTFANNNNQIGVPLTILSTPANTDFIVLEHGTNHFGEIEFTANIAQPDLALITNIGNSHIEFLESKEKVLAEKIQLFVHRKENGFLFINTDDPFINKVKRNFNNTITYGFKGKPNIKAKMLGTTNDAKENILIDGFGKKIETNLPLLGKANVQNYIASVAVALKLGISKKDIIKATAALMSVKGRMEIKKYKNFTIIDDTYNANPESVKSSLDVLKNFNQRTKKILVFGDMFELGKESETLHKNLAVSIDKIENIEVYTIGKETEKLSNELKKAVAKKHFRFRKQLTAFMEKLIIEDSVILLKGSRGMKMEEFVDVLKSRAN
jgi:UDP-N-acetylmuramoyl-tripeptide--D-alanyl-D-alanine ligase